jgi:hypothetical protein
MSATFCFWLFAPLRLLNIVDSIDLFLSIRQYLFFRHVGSLIDRFPGIWCISYRIEHYKVVDSSVISDSHYWNTCLHWLVSVRLSLISQYVKLSIDDKCWC